MGVYPFSWPLGNIMRENYGRTDWSGHMLKDLDELVLSCRSSQAKGYISEAVACYRAGAFRSSIVSTWIAIVFDFMDKLLELESLGDKEASRHLIAIRTFQGRSDASGIDASLKFENSLLADAMTTFELITPIQHADLERLRDDRNRCAHPSIQEEGVPYFPSGELARYHIRTAVDYLLSQPPVQGKAALERLFQEVESALFPTTVEGVVALFTAGPLRRAKQTLVKNFCIATLKMTLAEETAKPHRGRGVRALQALHEMYPENVEEALRKKLPDTVRAMPDHHLPIVLGLLRRVPATQEALDSTNTSRIRRSIEVEEGPRLGAVLREALQIPVFRDTARKRLASLDLSSLVAQVGKQPLDDLLDEAVSRYASSANFDSANNIGRQLILANLSSLNPNHVDAIRAAILENDQVRRSVQAPRVVQGLLQLSSSIGSSGGVWADFHRSLKDTDREGASEGILAVLEEQFPGLQDDRPQNETENDTGAEHRSELDRNV